MPKYKLNRLNICIILLSFDLCSNDKTRVIHTDGQKWIAYGAGDRKVKFLDSSNGHQIGPVIHGHAGSIKCIALCERERFVLSGSYDTSIRLVDQLTIKSIKYLNNIDSFPVHK